MAWWYTADMVRIAYFQAFNGISGDMTLGALVDAGLSLEALTEGVGGLGLDGYRLEARKVLRGAIQATRLRVALEGEAPSSPSPERGAGDHHHAHDHAHVHDHTHAQNRPASSPEPSSAHAHRALSDILRLIERSTIPVEVKERAAAVFSRLGEAEARIHGIDVEEVQFHEVGALDSIVDIVGSCLALHLLGVDEVYSSTVNVGSGSVYAAHGKLPLPAPATLELLKGVPVEQMMSQFELTTPTGAALLATLAKSFGPMPASRPVAVGYGAGDDRPGPSPNVLRVVLAERLAVGSETDRVLLLQTNLDDMSPQWLAHLMDQLFAAGALDVFVTPIIMKKSRQAQQLSVIAPLDREGKVADTLFQESTTFGVRRSVVDRLLLARETHPVATPWGEVRVKVGSRGGQEVSATPEYEDLRQAAARAKLPLKEMHRRVMEIFRGRD